MSDGSNANNYQDNLSCSWLIEPARATSVTATFNNFDVNNAGDTLYFYDGTNNSAPLIGRFTGNALPNAVTANGGKMFVEFITDGSTNDAGWDFSYTSVIPPTCVGLTTLTAASGIVEDGSLTNNYDNNLNCTWLIQPAGSPAVINFDMTSLDLLIGGFPGDRVRIFDNAAATGFPLRTYTGTFTGGTVSSFTGVMLIEFTTNGSGVSQGWEGTYNSSTTFCVPQTTFTNNNGNFSDGSPFGQNYLDSYFKTIKGNLSDGGKAAIQAITIDDNLFDRYKNKQDFIQKHIFPGGFLPNKNSINKYVSDNGLTINSYISYADHYANTLAIWNKEFNKKWDLIKKQGFDITFKRMWEFYLSYCEAGFKSKNIDLIQFSLQNK